MTLSDKLFIPLDVCDICDQPIRVLTDGVCKKCMDNFRELDYWKTRDSEAINKGE